MGSKWLKSECLRRIRRRRIEYTALDRRRRNLRRSLVLPRSLDSKNVPFDRQSPERVQRSAVKYRSRNSTDASRSNSVSATNSTKRCAARSSDAREATTWSPAAKPCRCFSNARSNGPFTRGLISLDATLRRALNLNPRYRDTQTLPHARHNLVCFITEQIRITRCDKTLQSNHRVKKCSCSPR